MRTARGSSFTVKPGREAPLKGANRSARSEVRPASSWRRRSREPVRAAPASLAHRVRTRAENPAELGENRGSTSRILPLSGSLAGPLCPPSPATDESRLAVDGRHWLSTDVFTMRASAPALSKHPRDRDTRSISGTGARCCHPCAPQQRHRVDESSARGSASGILRPATYSCYSAAAPRDAAGRRISRRQ